MNTGLRALRHASLAVPLVLLWLAACDGTRPLEPGLEAANNNSTVPAPSNTKVTATSASGIDVAWQDNSTNEAGFEVWVAATGVSDYGLWTTTAANVTSRSFTGINPGQDYCAKVRAFT